MSVKTNVCGERLGLRGGGGEYVCSLPPRHEGGHVNRSAYVTGNETTFLVLCSLRTQLAAAEKERDEARNHDRQPYPTAWAYEQACKALQAAKAEADLQRSLREQTLQTVANVVGGLVEGRPTGPHNYLQRLRALLKIEGSSASLHARVSRLEVVGRNLIEHAMPGDDGTMHVQYGDIGALRLALGDAVEGGA